MLNTKMFVESYKYAFARGIEVEFKPQYLTAPGDQPEANAKFLESLSELGFLVEYIDGEDKGLQKILIYYPYIVVEKSQEVLRDLKPYPENEYFDFLNNVALELKFSSELGVDDWVSKNLNSLRKGEVCELFWTMPKFDTDIAIKRLREGGLLVDEIPVFGSVMSPDYRVRLPYTYWIERGGMR